MVTWVVTNRVQARMAAEEILGALSVSHCGLRNNHPSVRELMDEVVTVLTCRRDDSRRACVRSNLG